MKDASSKINQMRASQETGSESDIRFGRALMTSYLGMHPPKALGSKSRWCSITVHSLVGCLVFNRYFHGVHALEITGVLNFVSVSAGFPTCVSVITGVFTELLFTSHIISSYCCFEVLLCIFYSLSKVFVIIHE